MFPSATFCWCFLWLPPLSWSLSLDATGVMTEYHLPRLIRTQYGALRGGNEFSRILSISDRRVVYSVVSSTKTASSNFLPFISFYFSRIHNQVELRDVFFPFSLLPFNFFKFNYTHRRCTGVVLLHRYATKFLPNRIVKMNLLPST